MHVPRYHSVLTAPLQPLQHKNTNAKKYAQTECETQVEHHVLVVVLPESHAAVDQQLGRDVYGMSSPRLGLWPPWTAGQHRGQHPSTAVLQNRSICRGARENEESGFCFQDVREREVGFSGVGFSSTHHYYQFASDVLQA